MIRKQFPLLDQQVNGNPLIYFDNAATTQKPVQVIDAIDGYYRGYNANIHRGIHTLAEKATDAFEQTRSVVRSFMNASSMEEVIFTYGTTDSINLVAQSFGRKFLEAGDEVIISEMEHHSNIVPWQMVCAERGARLKIIPVNDAGELIMDHFDQLLSPRTKLVSIVHVSNSLGTINPVAEIIRKAHLAGARVLIDGAQAAAHLPLDVQELDCDFYAFSSHKMFGPTGVGILYGKKDILNEMPPYRGGGEMIREVTFEKTTYNDLPFKFEAGTPNIADVIGFRTALEFILEISKPLILQHERALLAHAHERLSKIEGLRIIGTAREKLGVVSFIIEDLHAFDIGMLLDAAGIAIRTGHHCTQPLMKRFGIEGTARISFSVYNTFEEIDFLTERLLKIIKIKRR
ncbi:MAG: cysteine desulfurase [Cyclobacteriaceae bacterium]|nr:cysteine desulfurase [Cyclobacteriaceae bacterium]